MSDSRTSSPDPGDPPSSDRDTFYLSHMLESIERYSASTANLDSDELTQDAILRKLQLLTESSKRISTACRNAHPEISWRELIGFRNVVVHDYLGIRVERILPIVKGDIPPLKISLQNILSAK